MDRPSTTVPDKTFEQAMMVQNVKVPNKPLRTTYGVSLESQRLLLPKLTRKHGHNLMNKAKANKTRTGTNTVLLFARAGVVTQRAPRPPAGISSTLVVVHGSSIMVYPRWAKFL